MNAIITHHRKITLGSTKNARLHHANIAFLDSTRKKEHWFLPGGKGVIGSLHRAGGPASEFYQKEQLLFYISDNSRLTQLYIPSKAKRTFPFFN